MDRPSCPVTGWGEFAGYDALMTGEHPSKFTKLQRVLPRSAFLIRSCYGDLFPVMSVGSRKGLIVNYIKLWGNVDVDTTDQLDRQR